MRKKRVIKKSSYILVSVTIAMIIIFTALPYYCLTSIALPGWNIYWSYEEIQKKMLFLFPVLSGIGACSTIYKKNDIEDVVLNIALPFVVLLSLKTFQYIPWVFLVVLWLGIMFTVSGVSNFENGKGRYCGKAKRLRIIYYICRKRMIYFLLFLLIPMAVWVNYQENDNDERILFQSNSDESLVNEEECSLYLSQDEWEELTVEERYKKIEEFTLFECERLGVGEVNIYALKEMYESRLAYYTSEENAIYYNVYFLDECTLREALHTACHEVYHKYEQAIVDSLAVLEDSGTEYETLAYYNEAIEMKIATENYWNDSQEMDTYTQNYLEMKSEEYAENELKELEELGYIK